MATLAVVPSSTSSTPLYAIEEQLAALIDTADLVPEEQKQEFLLEFQRSLATAVEKRDRVGQFMAHLEQQAAFAKDEIDRLRERKSTYERALERAEEYVQRTIESLGFDDKGKYRKLEGKTVTFSLRACPPSVDIADEAAVPSEFKTIGLKLPATTWEEVLTTLPAELRIKVLDAMKCPEISIDKKRVKQAIDSGAEVPGADLAIGNYSLRRS